jgi:hypothetical protein
VSRLIAKNWIQVLKKLKGATASEFRPRIVLKGTGRAVTGVDFDGVARRRAEILSKYGRFVKTDIARFYPSIYTHAIAWAIVGKTYAKANHKSAAFKKSFANQLDAAVRAGQEGQTVGIPIGPDTSRIISELVAVEIEREVLSLQPDWLDRSVRYVDDMIIGVDETESEAQILSVLSSCLYEYELELNAAKTAMHGLGQPHAPEWIHYIRNFRVSRRADQQRDDLDSYFEHAIYLSDQNPQDNVLLFACKRATTLAIVSLNQDHLIRWLLYCCRRSPSCLRFVSEYLAANPPSGGAIQAEIQNFILRQIPRGAAAGHTEELAWLLFWAREIGLLVPDNVINECSHLRSSAVAMIALDLRQLGLVSGILDETFWRSFCSKDGLASEMWLVSYEATMKGWWSTAQSDAYITGHQFFADILGKQVSFYDEARKAKAKRRVPFERSSLVHHLSATYSMYDV